MWRVDVVEDCIGSGVCAGTAPHRFTLGEDNRARPPAEPVPPEDVILDAAASCPMEAIRVTNLDTGAPVDP